MSTEHDLLIIGDGPRVNFLKGEDNACFEAPQEEYTDIVRSLENQPNHTHFNYPDHACIKSSTFEKGGATAECFGDFLTSAANLCGTDNQRSLRIVLQSWNLSLDSVRKQIRLLKRKIRAGKKNPSSVLESSYWRKICGKTRGKNDRKFQYRLSLNPCFNGDEESLHVENMLDGQVSKSTYSFNWGYMYMERNEKNYPFENLDKNTNSNTEIAETSAKIGTIGEVEMQLCEKSTLEYTPPKVLEQSQNTQPLPRCTTYVEFADNVMYTAQECMLGFQMARNETVSKLRGPTDLENTNADLRIKERPPEEVDKPYLQEHRRQMADAGEPLLAADDSIATTQSNYEQSEVKTCAEVSQSFQETVREFQELNLIQSEKVQDVIDGLDRNQVKSNFETPLCFKKIKRCRPAKQTKDFLQGSRTSIKKLFISRSMSLNPGTAKDVALDVQQITTQSTRLVCLQLNKMRDRVKCRKHFGQNTKCRKEYFELNDVENTIDVTEAVTNKDVSERVMKSTNILHPEEPKMNEIMQCSKYFEQIKELIHEHLSSSNSVHTSNITEGHHTSYMNDKCTMVENRYDVQDKAMHWEMCPKTSSREARRFEDKCCKDDNETAVVERALYKNVRLPIKDKLWSPTQIRYQGQETFLQGRDFGKGDLEPQCLLYVENKQEKSKDKSDWRLPSQIILSFLRFGLELHRKKMGKILDDNNLDNNPGKTLQDLVVCIQACVDLCEKFFIDLTNSPTALHEKNVESSLGSPIAKTTLGNFTFLEFIDKDRPSTRHNAIAEIVEDPFEIEYLKSERSCEDLYECSTPTIASMNDLDTSLLNGEHSEMDVLSGSQASDSHAMIYRNVSSNRPADNESGAVNRYSIRPSPRLDHRPSYIDEINTEPHGKFYHKQNNSPFYSAFKNQPRPSELDFKDLNKKVSTYRIRKQKAVPVSPPGEHIVAIERGPSLSSSPAPMPKPIDLGIDYEHEFKSDNDDESPGMGSHSSKTDDCMSLVQISPPRLSHEPCVCRGMCKCGASIIRRASRYLETKIQPYLQNSKQTPPRSSDVTRERMVPVPKQRSLFYLKETPKQRSRYKSADFSKDNFEPPKINSISEEERKTQIARLSQISYGIKPSMSSSNQRSPSNKRSSSNKRSRPNKRSSPNQSTVGFKRKSMLSLSSEMPSEFQLRSSTSLSNQKFADYKRKSSIKTSINKPPTFQWKPSISPSGQRFNDSLMPRTSSYMSNIPSSDFQRRSTIPTSSPFPLRPPSPQPMPYENRLMPSVSSSSQNRLKSSFSSSSQSRLKLSGPEEGQGRLKPSHSSPSHNRLNPSFSSLSQSRLKTFFLSPSERMTEPGNERPRT